MTGRRPVCEWVYWWQWMKCHHIYWVVCSGSLQQESPGFWFFSHSWGCWEIFYFHFKLSSIFPALLIYNQQPPKCQFVWTGWRGSNMLICNCFEYKVFANWKCRHAVNVAVLLTILKSLRLSSQAQTFRCVCPRTWPAAPKRWRRSTSGRPAETSRTSCRHPAPASSSSSLAMWQRFKVRPPIFTLLPSTHSVHLMNTCSHHGIKAPAIVSRCWWSFVSQTVRH